LCVRCFRLRRKNKNLKNRLPAKKAQDLPRAVVRGSYDFLVSVQYVVFGGGRTIFLVWGFANKRESRTYDSVYDLRRENTTENTLLKGVGLPMLLIRDWTV
jgi:hypothetical protein